MKRWIIGAIAPLAVVAVAITIPVFAQAGSSTLLLVHRDGGDLYIALGS